MKALPAAGAGLLVLAGCGATSTHRHPPRAIPTRLPIRHAPPPQSAGDVSVRILTPAPSQTMGSRLVVHVQIRRFALQRQARNPSALEHERLLEFSLDRGRFDEPRYSGANGRLAVDLAVNGYYSPAYAPTITYQHIPAGRHILTVTLANSLSSPTRTHTAVAFYVARRPTNAR